MIDDTYVNYPCELNQLPFIRETPPWVIPGTTAGGPPLGTAMAAQQGFPQNPTQTGPGQLIPGTTAGPTSPGVMGFPGYSPAPLVYGSTAPQPSETPAGPTGAQAIGQGFINPDDYIAAPGSPTLLGDEYTQGFLRSIIGEKVRVEFLLGEDTLQDRRGTLLAVGITYILLNETETDDVLLCDIFSIKFVTVYR